MGFTRRRDFAGSFVCTVLLTVSISVGATDIDEKESGISVEGWSVRSGQEIPILSFGGTPVLDEVEEDIQVENIMQDKDGSIRFQLSHRGPMSRQVFASVRRVEQDDGFTRSIITNIADGHQTEYLSRTADLPPVAQQVKTRDVSFLDELERLDEQNAECLACVIYLVVEATCVVAESRAFQRCHRSCQDLGGVRYFDSGACGSSPPECTCWTKPLKEAREF